MTGTQKLLAAELDGLQALLNSRLVVMQVDRETIVRQMRVLEIMLYGEPRTEIAPRHHA